LLTPAIILMVVGSFIPDTKQSCIIYALPRMSDSEQAQQIPDKILKLANKQLDQWIDEFDIVSKKEK